MKRKFIVDEEIKLIDGSDFLNTKVYADNLKVVIENAPEKNSFTVGLFGEWGTGKSSIIKTVKEDLEKTEGKKIKFITYDTWKYSNDSFRRMFLLCMKDELKHTASKLMNSFYLNESEDVKIKKKFNLKNVLIIVSILVVGLLIINFLPKSNEDENWKLSLSMVISFLGLFATIFLKVFDELKVNIQKPHLFAPEQFEDCFKEMVEKSIKHYNYIQKTIQFVTGNNFEKDIDRLVIVIDNIDRCHKEMAYELLTNIKNFLGNPYNIIFVIPVDDSALRKHILSNSKNNENGECDREAEEFLRKFFNVTIRIKPYHSEEIFDFSEKINKKYALDFSPDTINIVSKEYARNPRRLIQLFNNLSVELCSFTENFAKQYESVICKLLIIREEFPDYYNKLALNSYLINNANAEELKDNNKYPGLIGFLNNTRVVTLNIATSVLDKILSNSKVFSGISQDLSISINNLDIENVSKFIDEDLSRNDVVIKFIINQLKKGKERNAYDSEVIPKFDFITVLNEKYPLDSYQNKRIQEIIDDNNILEIIFNKNNLISAITYCYSSFKQEIPYLLDYFIKHVNNQIVIPDKPVDRWSDAFKFAIKTFQEKNILEKLREAFKKYYTLDHYILDFEDLSDYQIEALVSEDLQIFIIDNITNLSDDDWAYLDFMCLTGRINISEKIANHLINKLNINYPNFNLKSIQEINTSLVTINSGLNMLDNFSGNINSELNTLFAKVVSNRLMPHPHPIHTNNRAMDQPANFIDQSVNDAQIVKNIIYFCCNIYRLSNGNISVTEVFIKLLSNPTNRAPINTNLNSLIESYSLVPFFDIIVSDNTYSTDSFALLKIALTSKKGLDYIVTDDKISNKLNECLNLIYANDSRANEIIGFLEGIKSDERIKHNLIIIISTQTRDNILKLSPVLQALAIDAVLDGENIFKFKDNIEFLKAVASNGGPKHIQKLTNLLISKIQQQTLLQEAITILLEVKRLNSKDADRILKELENKETDESNKDTIIQAIAHVEEIREDKKINKKEE